MGIDLEGSQSSSATNQGGERHKPIVVLLGQAGQDAKHCKPLVGK
jgi:hypothetical protein